MNQVKENYSLDEVKKVKNCNLENVISDLGIAYLLVQIVN